MNLTETQWALAIAFGLILINYIAAVAYDAWTTSARGMKEGFKDGAKDSSDLVTWETDVKEIYDDIYAKAYDQLTQHITQTAGKIKLSVEVWSKDGTDPASWTVLDAGCGTGVGCVGLAKLGVGNVLGVDISKAMINQAKDIVIPQSTLNPTQKEHISFRNADLLDPSACSPGEVKHTICQYFTFYYLKDQEAFFQNVYLWTKPGGTLHLEVVNKHKFDPILESATPILGFSVQKYHEDRQTKSKVKFDAFDYESEFLLIDPKAEFRETLRFRNNRVRRQKHVFHMPDVEQITKMATMVGWKYEGYLDLISIGFEYAYTLMFRKLT